MQERWGCRQTMRTPGGRGLKGVWEVARHGQGQQLPKPTDIHPQPCSITMLQGQCRTAAFLSKPEPALPKLRIPLSSLSLTFPYFKRLTLLQASQASLLFLFID